VLRLERDNSTLLEELERLKNKRTAENRRKMEKLDSLQVTMDERDRQLKDLWNVIQMLDDENMTLKRESENWEKRENILKKEINGLKLFVGSSRAGDITVSNNALDWKDILEDELSSLGTQSQKVHKMVSSTKIAGRRRRWIQCNMRKTSEKVQKKLAFSNNTKSTCEEVVEESKSCENVHFRDRMPEKKTVKRVEREDKERVSCFWSNEEVLHKPHEKKCSIWGTGMWPPEWTTVPIVNLQKNWCQASEA